MCSCRGEVEGKSVCRRGDETNEVREWDEATETSTGRRKSLLCAVGSSVVAGAMTRRADTAAAAAATTPVSEVATSGTSRSDVVDGDTDASRCRLEVCQ